VVSHTKIRVRAFVVNFGTGRRRGINPFEIEIIFLLSENL
jgi:hypothetical protein